MRLELEARTTVGEATAANVFGNALSRFADLRPNNVQMYK